MNYSRSKEFLVTSPVVLEMDEKVLNDKPAHEVSFSSAEGQPQAVTNLPFAIRVEDMLLQKHQTYFQVHLLIRQHETMQNLNSSRSSPTLPSYITWQRSDAMRSHYSRK